MSINLQVSNLEIIDWLDNLVVFGQIMLEKNMLFQKDM